MSAAFNILVPFTVREQKLCAFMDWDMSIGRIRYGWVTEATKQGHILFKDGPTSWSENKEEVEKAIRSHPAFVSYEVVERDNVYVKATFDLTKTRDFSEEDFKQIIEVQARAKERFGDKWTHWTENPFDIFDRNLKKMSEGNLDPGMAADVANLADKIKKAFDNPDSSPIIEV